MNKDFSQFDDTEQRNFEPAYNICYCYQGPIKYYTSI